MTTQRLERTVAMPACRPTESLRGQSWQADAGSLVPVDGIKPVNGYLGLPATHNPVGAPSS
jgi:hypothetical protein